MASPTPNASTEGSTRLLVIALVLALVAVILMNFYVEVVRAQAKPNQKTIYRLNRSVKVGDRLNMNDLEPIRVAEELLEGFSDAMLKRTEVENMIGDGRRFTTTAGQGKWLTADLLVENRADRLDRKITPGKRLVALPVNSRTLPGELKPGMYVDIEAPFGSATGVPEVLTVMERVMVKLVGSVSIDDVREDGTTEIRRFSTISIEVDPEVATQLSKITKMVSGDFELQLRNPADEEHVKIQSGTLHEAVLRKIRESPSTSTLRN